MSCRTLLSFCDADGSKRIVKRDKAKMCGRESLKQSSVPSVGVGVPDLLRETSFMSGSNLLSFKTKTI
jgi:hypothetical protein